MNLFKRIRLNLAILVNAFFRGMKSVDDIMTNSRKSDDGSGIEKHDEQKSVYKNLLKGEVTQEVVELRYEMYHSERKSHDFVYSGNGTVEKREDNAIKDGIVDNGDGLKILFVQNNIIDTSSLSDFGIDVCGNEYSSSEGGDLDKKERLFSFERKILPRYKIEKYINKLVVKEKEDNKVVLDFYTGKYPQEFDNIHKMFVREMNKGYEFLRRSDIFVIDGFKFVTQAAYGVPDMMEYQFENLRFVGISEYDGNFILKFEADMTIGGRDLIDEVYDKIAEDKCKNHESRGVSTIELETVLAQNSEEYNVNRTIELLKNLNNGDNS